MVLYIKEDFVNFKNMCSEIKDKVYEDIDELKKMSSEEIISKRYEKFRQIGIFTEK